jgi:hypothetical protein
MFFHVSKQQTKTILPGANCQVNGFYVTVDNGWSQHKQILYKGYALGQNLDIKVREKNFNECPGNYTILDFSNGFDLYTDDSRSYPLYYNSTTVSNIDQTLEEVWIDGSVCYSDDRFAYQSKKEKRIRYTPRKQLNFQGVVDTICGYLVPIVENLNTNLPLFAADSGGVDSLLVASAFDYVGKSYRFVKRTQHPVGSDLWGYKQLYYSDQPHLQITGYCGDEVLLRNPLYCQWLLQSEGVDLKQEFAKVSHSYMKGFFEANYRKKLQTLYPQFATRQCAFNHVANMIVNDFQMWHYNETITFTPFRNLWLIEQMLYADADTIVKQVVNAEVSKAAILRLSPKNLAKISLHKNNKVP